MKMPRRWLVLAVLVFKIAWAQAPAYTADSIVNASDYSPGPFAPNSVLSIFGSNLSWYTAAFSASQSFTSVPVALSGVEVYVDGGWAVDAVLGRETRPHSDLDIALPHKHVPTLREILGTRGYREQLRDDTWECNFVLADEHGRQVDVHSFTLDEAGVAKGRFRTRSAAIDERDRPAALL